MTLLVLLIYLTVQSPDREEVQEEQEIKPPPQSSPY